MINPSSAGCSRSLRCFTIHVADPFLVQTAVDRWALRRISSHWAAVGVRAANLSTDKISLAHPGGLQTMICRIASS